MRTQTRFSYIYYCAALLLVVGYFIPLSLFAHEVYVLSPFEVQRGLETPAFSPLEVIVSNQGKFLFWTLGAILVVSLVFLLSVSHRLEKRFDPLLMRLKKYTPSVARATIGLSFLVAAYYQAIFGPELPLSLVFGSFAPLATIALIAIGMLLVFDRYTRAAALAALALFTVAAFEQGWYMLTYTNYLGGIAVLIFLGTGMQGHINDFIGKIGSTIAPYRFLILRVTFGISLLYASLYAKFIHNYLAFQVASMPLPGYEYSLAYYFGLDPQFLVVGAGIIEIVIALFFILGLEIRFTAIFLEFWLALSLWYFGESVWPHLILIGIPIGLFLHGYDRYSIEGYFLKRGGREPVL